SGGLLGRTGGGEGGVCGWGGERPSWAQAVKTNPAPPPAVRPRASGDPVLEVSALGPGSPPARGRTARERDCSGDPEQLLRVAVADLLLVGRGKPDRVEHRHRRTDVARPFLLVERAVGRK